MSIVASTARDCRLLLHRLLVSDLLNSQYDQYLEQNIRRAPIHGDGNFYTQTRKSRGFLAAEAELEKWNAASRRSDYAAAVKPVVRGLLSIAMVNELGAGDLLHLVNIEDKPSFPHDPRFNAGQMIVFTNRLSLTSTEPAGSEIFGPLGSLDLKAVTFSYPANNTCPAQLGIVLSVQGERYSTHRYRTLGFTVITVDLEGTTSATTFLPDELTSRFFRSILLGQTGELPVRHLRKRDEPLDEALGFTGATSYLADKLRELEHYLFELAYLLDPDVRHDR